MYGTGDTIVEMESLFRAIFWLMMFTATMLSLTFPFLLFFH